MPHNNQQPQENNPVTNKYVPEPRLVDDPERLEELYCERGLVIQEIADDHSECGKTRVYEALVEFDLTGDDEASSVQSDHSDSSSSSRVNWSRMK